jgi:NADPH:quinone reductase-like Zn-dependent oxidoreductase
VRAIVRDTYGPAAGLHLREVSRPPIGGNDVLVRVHAAAVDPGVWIFMTGRPLAVRLATGLRRPRVAGLGRDLAGVVAEVGAGVTGLRPGDEVYGTCETGSLAEYAVARPQRLARKPAGLTFEQAAAVPISAVTALQSLGVAGVSAGQHVMIIGAGGGVGTYAVQLARASGAVVTAVCSGAKAELVRSLGAEHVIDYTRQEITDRGERYDVVVDTAGNRPLSLLRQVAGERGAIVLVGGGHARGRWLGGFQRQMAAPVLSLFGAARVLGVTARVDRQSIEELTPLLESGAVTPVIGGTHALADAAAALRELEQGHPTGKIVVTIA